MGPIGGDDRIGSNNGTDSNVAELCDKILQNLNNAFEKDDLLDEFDIIPCESRLNQSPVLHDLTLHKLALESWCVPYLYKHSYHQFLWICKKGRKSSISSSSSTTNPTGTGSVATINCAISNRDKEISRKLSCLSEFERISRGLMLSRILIILNPDLTLSWNYRRDFFQPSTLEILEKEQKLVSLIMSRKPKCPEGFTYRKWLIKKALRLELVDSSSIQNFISQEMEAIEEPIRRYSTNYHAWSYRQWLLELVLTYDKTIITRDQKDQLLQRELQRSNNWIKANVSDYSGCHYRQKLLASLLTSSSGGISLFLNELEDNERRIFLYEGHESLWHHRRAVLHILLNHLKQTQGNEDTIVISAPETAENANALEKKLQRKESDLVQQVESKQCIDKECSKLNYDLCQDYIKWMERRFKWDLTKSVHLVEI